MLLERYQLQELWEEYDNTRYWRAFDEETDSEVFVQELRPRAAPARDRRPTKESFGLPGELKRQVRVLPTAERQHLLNVHDVVEHAGSLWIVMDPVQPLSLHHLLRQQGRFGPAGAVHICAELAESLAELHSSGLVHGQFDPRNVFFRPDQTAALAGYGLTTDPLGDGGPWVRPWRPGSPYTAPEQAKSRDIPPRPSRAGDLWALGMTLYELAHGPAVGRRVLAASPLRALPDSRPPRVRGERELTLLLRMLLAPHPGARSSADPAVVSLRRLAQSHAPPPSGHWAVPSRFRRPFGQRVRDALLKLGARVTSRLVAAVLVAVLATMLGIHLAGKSKAHGWWGFVLQGVVIGVAYALVTLGAQGAIHVWAYYVEWRRRRRGTPSPLPPAPSPPSPPAALAASPPQVPECTPRLTVRDRRGVTVGRPVRLDFTLDVPEGHPWHLPVGRPAELVLLAQAHTAATVTPPAVGYRVAPVERATFRFTAHEPGHHHLRLTVYDRHHGLVLQELDATMEVDASGSLGSVTPRTLEP
ncbi:serine/threonine protein kinase [Streptomyces sp. NPDC056039]|uniref:serine/threonine protein kinase n=1 Tax=Streptomyces sp. NPDC056039 TaxID=3345687 RepID=UPI0035DBC06A